MIPSTHFKDITDADYVAEVEQAEGVVFLEFYRTSCGSCRDFAPILEAFAEQYKGQVKFLRLNTDVGGTYHAKRLGVPGDPTSYVLYKNNVEGSFTGAAHAKYFMPMMADIFKSMGQRLGITPPTAVIDPSAAIPQLGFKG